MSESASNDEGNVQIYHAHADRYLLAGKDLLVALSPLLHSLLLPVLQPTCGILLLLPVTNFTCSIEFLLAERNLRLGIPKVLACLLCDAHSSSCTM